MGCNCGGAARAPQRAVVYRLILPNGVVRDYVTVHEANAANSRAGNTGTVVPVHP